ncbi:hypothetical protein EON80_03950 [bacterium]|nr:MAG: hypothetical protein EON80_03950 [bacterium]
MPRTLQVLQVIYSLLRHRAARVVFWVLVAFWVFDRLIYFVTETQWFASAGQAALWSARCRAQVEIFVGSALVCSIVALLFLRPVARINGGGDRLRGKLAGFEPFRVRISRFAWWLTLLTILVTASRLTRLWPDWLLLRAGMPGEIKLSYLGWPVQLWTHFLPAIVPFLNALWLFSLLLLPLVALTGVLRALPELAARRPAPPLVLTRTLWLLGGWLLALRAVLHLVHVVDLPRGRVLQTGDVFVSAPLFAAGGVACFVLAIVALRRAAEATSRRKLSKLTASMLAAVWLPGIVNWISGPERGLLPETTWLKEARRGAATAAWGLDFPSPPAATAAISPEKAWPVWNEKILLQSLGPPTFRNNKLVTWQRAELGLQGEKWSAIGIAQGAESGVWNASHDTGASTQLTLESLDFSPPNKEVEGTALNGIQAYFGFEGHSLFTDEKIGVPIASIGSKWLWAWRLRDVLLPVNGASQTHLLVYRGAEERAQRLTPFWKVGGQPQFILNDNAPFWLLDLCATSSNYPGTMSAPDGELKGVNAASDAVKLLVDARTGEVSFYKGPARPQASPLTEIWNRGLPGVLQASERFPAKLQPQWRPAREMLASQLSLFNELQDGTIGRIIAAYLGQEAGGKAITRMLAIKANSIELLEVPHGSGAARSLRRGDFDLATRLVAIDAAIGKVQVDEGRSVVAGEPFIWPDAKVAGGFRLGRAFFSVPHEKPVSDGGDRTVRLWRVALTGLTSNARINIAESVRAATLAEQETSGATAFQKSGRPFPTASQALRAIQGMEAAVKGSDWEAFGRESQRAREILERMAVPTPTN